MDIDIATLNEPPKIKIDKQSKVKTKKNSTSRIFRSIII